LFAVNDIGTAFADDLGDQDDVLFTVLIDLNDPGQIVVIILSHQVGMADGTIQVRLISVFQFERTVFSDAVIAYLGT
jgi:hypothetical protein